MDTAPEAEDTSVALVNRGDNDGDVEGGMVNCGDDDDGAGGDKQTTRG